MSNPTFFGLMPQFDHVLRSQSLGQKIPDETQPPFPRRSGMVPSLPERFSKSKYRRISCSVGHVIDIFRIDIDSTDHGRQWITIGLRFVAITI